MRRTITVLSMSVLYDDTFWRAERNIINVHDGQASTVSLYHNTTDNLLATYTLDEAHDVAIDMSDFLRVAPIPASIIIKSNASETPTANISIGTSGLIDPSKMLAPSGRTSAIIEVPSMMLQPCSWSAIMFEVYSKYGGLLMFPPSTYEVAFAPDELTNVEPPFTPSCIQLVDNQAKKVVSTTLKPLDDCKRYCSVEWVSATGRYRRHTFEVRDVKINTGEVVSLETLDNSYNEIKGRVCGLTLHLDDLTAYDYWYYSDLVTSSKVLVDFDSGSHRVEVTTKSVTLPNSEEGKLNKLDIDVNFARYDAVTM